jgi:hypothetical protein
MDNSLGRCPGLWRLRPRRPQRPGGLPSRGGRGCHGIAIGLANIGDDLGITAADQSLECWEITVSISEIWRSNGWSLGQVDGVYRVYQWAAKKPQTDEADAYSAEYAQSDHKGLAEARTCFLDFARGSATFLFFCLPIVALSLCQHLRVHSPMHYWTYPVLTHSVAIVEQTRQIILREQT